MTRSPIRHAYEPSAFWHGIGKAGLWRLFGNTLPPALNLRYLRYGAACRSAAGTRAGLIDWPLRNEDPVVVRGALAPERAAAMVAKVSTATEDDTLRPHPDLPFMIPVPEPCRFFGEAALDIFDGPLGETIERMLGSRFRIEWLDYYRALPGAPAKSWLWHIDNDPPFVLKVLLYLTDSTVENGATCILPRAETRRLFRRGYFGIRGDERRVDVDDSATAERPVEVLAGDALVFSTNLLHKGGQVHRGFRDVMSFLILPSPRPWREELDRFGFDYIHAASGFPIDPSL
jgi:hypothetical protein